VNKIRARAVPLVPATGTRPRTRLFQAVVAQLVEQLIRNQQVSGSNPLNGSNLIRPKPLETVAFFVRQRWNECCQAVDFLSPCQNHLEVHFTFHEGYAENCRPFPGLAS
jgi:hypothetical protein